MDALTEQMEENLQLLAQSKAEEINLRLDEVMRNTLIAAHMATEVLADTCGNGRYSRKYPPLFTRSKKHYRPGCLLQ